MKALWFALAMLAPISGQADTSGHAPVPEALQPVTAGPEIEMEVIFWYGCRYCFSIEDDLRSLAEARGDAVEVIHVPAPLNKAWANHARLYYLIEDFGLPWSAHEDAYRAVIESEGERLATEEEIVEFLAGYELDVGEIEKRYSSDQIIDSVRSSYLRLKDYEIGVTPSVVVDGEWLVNGYTVGGVRGITKEVQRLLEN